MAADGRAIVFISHKLHEVLAVSDRITVLRGGRVVATLATESATPEGLAALMVGREVETGGAPERTSAIGDVVLEAHDLHAEGDRGAACAERRLAGGAWRRDRRCGGGRRQRPARARRGADGNAPAHAGRVSVEGVDLRAGDPRDAIARGVAHVPEDRLGTGVAPSLSIAEQHGAQGLSRRRHQRRPLPAPQPHPPACDRADRAVLGEHARPRDARPRSLGRQPAEGRDRARVRRRAARSRGRGADPRAGRRGDRERARAPARPRLRAASRC